MKISNQRPPNYEKFLTHFPVLEKYKPVFAYGDTLYNPFNMVITPDLMYHEQTHLRQQGNDPEGWYNLYFNDSTFRLTQEVEAYREQFKFFARNVKDRELVSHFLSALAEQLSSPLYGSLVDWSEARRLISS